MENGNEGYSSVSKVLATNGLCTDYKENAS